MFFTRNDSRLRIILPKWANLSGRLHAHASVLCLRSRPQRGLLGPHEDCSFTVTAKSTVKNSVPSINSVGATPCNFGGVSGKHRNRHPDPLPSLFKLGLLQLPFVQQLQFGGIPHGSLDYSRPFRFPEYVIFSCDGELTGTQDRGPGLVYVPGKV